MAAALVESPSTPLPAGPELARVYLQPGRLVATAQPTLVTTILGSCVAVCLWDRAARVGGINHFLLPHWAGEGPGSARFGNVALRLLIGELVALADRRPVLEAKLFGGACVIAKLKGGEEHLGARNVRVARSLLSEAGIPVVGEDVEGLRGRKLIFRTSDGAAWVKVLAAGGG